MCGIAGFVRVSGSGKLSREFRDYFARVLTDTSVRGADSFGIGGFTELSPPFYVKSKHLDCAIAASVLANYRLGYVLAGFRGVPTTEVWDESDASIQPYVKEWSGVTHNGMIANDAALAELYGYPRPFIDSYLLLDHFSGKQDTISRLRELESGSSFALYSHDSNDLLLARSFRGLSIGVWQDHKDTILVWASELEALQPEKYSTSEALVNLATQELPGYSFFKGRPTALWRDDGYSASYYLSVILRNCEFWAVKPTDRSCVVVCSGGLDSCTVATLACQQYARVHLLHFCYGARAQTQEMESVRLISTWLNEHTSAEVTVEYVDLSFLKNLGGSTLTEWDKPIAKGIEGVETAHEWVPARNLAMISLAAAYCDRHNISTIALGLNLEEGSVYCDNSQEFFARMNKALEFGTKSRPTLWMPLIYSMKHHIVKTALEIDAPLHLSWSCYYGDELRCGECGPCVMRRKAFMMNGLEDQVEYSYPMPNSLG